MQGDKQGSLEEAEPEHEVAVERGRERIALVESRLNAATGFAKAGVIDRHADQPPRTVCQSALQNRGEEFLRVPLRARVQVVLC